MKLDDRRVTSKLRKPARKIESEVPDGAIECWPSQYPPKSHCVLLPVLGLVFLSCGVISVCFPTRVAQVHKTQAGVKPCVTVRIDDSCCAFSL